MPTYATATVEEVLERTEGALRLSVTIDGLGASEVAVAYPQLVGEPRPGHQVLVNTTAVDLGLGTGGEHFVVADLTVPCVHALSGGHIVKLRYTPHQLDVLAAEEEGSPLADDLASAVSLEGAPVVVLSLHSQLAAACAVARREAPQARIAFVMDDSTALPVGVSRLITILKGLGVLHLVVSTGQAFGGDVETINRLTGLLVAKLMGMDLVVAGPGPGSVGTGSPLGHTGVAVGEWANAVAALRGRPIVAPRIGTADPRARHRGLSHHTRTALGVVALAGATVALPEMEASLAGAVAAVLEEDPRLTRHEWTTVGPVDAVPAMTSLELDVRTMGRSAEEEAALFDAAGAAVLIALAAGRP